MSRLDAFTTSVLPSLMDQAGQPVVATPPDDGTDVAMTGVFVSQGTAEETGREGRKRTSRATLQILAVPTSDHGGLAEPTHGTMFHVADLDWAIDPHQPIGPPAGGLHTLHLIRTRVVRGTRPDPNR